MFRSLKLEGTRRVTLAGTGRQKGGMLGESIGPVDNGARDTRLGGNRKCMKQGVPVQRAGCSSSNLDYKGDLEYTGRSPVSREFKLGFTTFAAVFVCFKLDENSYPKVRQASGLLTQSA
jgi:hypothetical protein